MSELTCLGFPRRTVGIHVLCQAGAGNVELPPAIYSPRALPAAASGLLFGRTTRALANYVEHPRRSSRLRSRSSSPSAPAARARWARRSGSWRGSSISWCVPVRRCLRPHGDLGDFDRRPCDDAGSAGVRFLEPMPAVAMVDGVAIRFCPGRASAAAFPPRGSSSSKRRETGCFARSEAVCADQTLRRSSDRYRITAIA